MTLAEVERANEIVAEVERIDVADDALKKLEKDHSLVFIKNGKTEDNMTEAEDDAMIESLKADRVTQRAALMAELDAI